MRYKLPLRRKASAAFCPYCLEPVGVIGNWFAVVFGTQIHGCDFSNVDWTVSSSDLGRSALSETRGEGKP